MFDHNPGGHGCTVRTKRVKRLLRGNVLRIGQVRSVKGFDRRILFSQFKCADFFCSGENLGSALRHVWRRWELIGQQTLHVAKACWLRIDRQIKLTTKGQWGNHRPLARSSHAHSHHVGSIGEQRVQPNWHCIAR
ncbi:MAG: hypothetical protein O9272_10365 [Brevundimonas sp.]|nr:hypothetical protein [Brevundimonas sp.]